MTVRQRPGGNGGDCSVNASLLGIIMCLLIRLALRESLERCLFPGERGDTLEAHHTLSTYAANSGTVIRPCVVGSWIVYSSPPRPAAEPAKTAIRFEPTRYRKWQLRVGSRPSVEPLPIESWRLSGVISQTAAGANSRALVLPGGG
jgi:hypothetical protein